MYVHTVYEHIRVNIMKAQRKYKRYLGYQISLWGKGQ